MKQGLKYQFDSLSLEKQYSVINLLYFIALVDNDINSNSNFIKEIDYINMYANHFGFSVVKAHDYFKMTRAEKMIENLKELKNIEKFYLYAVAYYLAISDDVFNQTEFEKIREVFEGIGFPIDRQTEILNLLLNPIQSKITFYLTSLNIEDYIIEQLNDYKIFLNKELTKNEFIVLIEHKIDKYMRILISNPDSPISREDIFLIMADVKKNLKSHFKLN